MEPNQAWQGGRVFVCEDAKLIGEIVCDYLRHWRLQPIGPAGRLDEAFTCLARERTMDVAVLDINLNSKLCCPLCDALLRRNVPFLFLTAYSDLSQIPPRHRKVSHRQ